MIVRGKYRGFYLAVIVGICCGLASALFLATLELSTHTREKFPILLFLLPLGGLLVGWLYHLAGKSVEGGNNLLIDTFHDPRDIVPFRMFPLVLIGTVITHLFGGSAGREGTAVQMGGSIADQLSHRFKLESPDRQALLMSGIAGGFGSVFGVPFAGAVFGIEVLAIGRLHIWALAECVISAFVAHYVTLACGIHHTAYNRLEASGYPPSSLLVTVVAGILFGLSARLFSWLFDLISRFSKKIIPHLPTRAMVGGAIISAVYYLAPLTTRYAGLGIPVILDSFQSRLPLYDWLGKVAFTALTLGTGFKGGEVTPLLFVGAALGNAISQFAPLSVGIAAAIGLVGVFAGAANTPIACTIMAIELFGHKIGIYAALACFASYAVSSHHGIYHSQRIHLRKGAQASRTLALLKRLVGIS